MSANTPTEYTNHLLANGDSGYAGHISILRHLRAFLNSWSFATRPLSLTRLVSLPRRWWPLWRFRAQVEQLFFEVVYAIEQPQRQREAVRVEIEIVT